MEKKENKVFVIILTSLFFLLFLLLVSGRVFLNQINELRKSAVNKPAVLNPTITEIDWEKLFPYDTKIDEIPIIFEETSSTDEAITAEDKTPSQNRISSVLLKLGDAGNSWSKAIYNYNDLSQLGFDISLRLSDPTVIYKNKGFFRSKNGCWIPEIGKVSLETAKQSIAPYVSLNNYLKKKGMPFLYCYTPSKECAFDNELPAEFESYANENIDMYLSLLKQNGIDCLDFRQNLHAEGLDHYSLFYKTDHHWNVQAGKWAISVLEKKLCSDYMLKMDNVNDLGNYKTVTYKNAMFGSYGNSVTRYAAQPENFDVIYPNFKTNLKIQIPDRKMDKTGTFEDVFVDDEAVAYYVNNGGGYVYEEMLYGNRPYMKITNFDKPNAPKILMIRDSFSISAVPYLALSCSEIVLLDARPTNGNFTGSIVNCINSYNPDIVIAFLSGPQDITLNK